MLLISPDQQELFSLGGLSQRSAETPASLEREKSFGSSVVFFAGTAFCHIHVILLRQQQTVQWNNNFTWMEWWTMLVVAGIGYGLLLWHALLEQQMDSGSPSRHWARSRYGRVVGTRHRFGKDLRNINLWQSRLFASGIVLLAVSEALVGRIPNGQSSENDNDDVNNEYYANEAMVYDWRWRLSAMAAVLSSAMFLTSAALALVTRGCPCVTLCGCSSSSRDLADWTDRASGAIYIMTTVVWAFPCLMRLEGGETNDFGTAATATELPAWMQALLHVESLQYASVVGLTICALLQLVADLLRLGQEDSSGAGETSSSEPYASYEDVVSAEPNAGRAVPADRAAVKGDTSGNGDHTALTADVAPPCTTVYPIPPVFSSVSSITRPDKYVRTAVPPPSSIQRLPSADSSGRLVYDSTVLRNNDNDDAPSQSSNAPRKTKKLRRVGFFNV